MSYNSKHFVYHFFRSATEDFYSFSCFEAEMRYSNSRKRHQGTDQKQKKSSCNKENVMSWNSCYHNFKGLSYKMLCTLYPVTHGPTFSQQMLLPSFGFFFQVLTCDRRERTLHCCSCQCPLGTFPYTVQYLLPTSCNVWVYCA